MRWMKLEPIIQSKVSQKEKLHSHFNVKIDIIGFTCDMYISRLLFASICVIPCLLLFFYFSFKN